MKTHSMFIFFLFSSLFVSFSITSGQNPPRQDISATTLAQRMSRPRYPQIPDGPPKSEQRQPQSPPSLLEIANGTKHGPAQSTNEDRRSRFRDGTAELQRRQEERGQGILPEAFQNTIPFWADSFTYQGLEFKYKMVGTDPKKGSRTTVIPAEIIPLRFVFADGQVFDASTDIIDGQTAVQGIINSPIFKNYNFILGGTPVGTTQYGDAFQRANFWDSVSTQARNYHVLLGEPTVFPTQTIIVPPDMGTYYHDPFLGNTVPLVNEDFLAAQEQLIRAALNLSPRSLAIDVWGSVLGESSLTPGFPAAGGWHGIQKLNSGLLTYVSASYFPDSEIDPRGDDVYGLSHEIAEWMDDPFIDNFSPGWNIAFNESERCHSGGIARGRLEVADPVAFFSEAVVTLPAPGFNYHVTEAMFIDFYTRSPRSRSVNGQYSMFTIGAPFGLASEPSSECVGSVQVEQHFIDVPGSISTSAQGINNQGDVVGSYLDQQNHIRGFKWTHGSFSAIDFPGARRTLPSKINDSGDIVGYFRDAANRQRGFLYTKGHWIQIDFPGSPNTIALGINSKSQIVGEYFDPVQLRLRGFILTNGQFAPVNTPLGQNCGLADINDAGSFVGSTWDDTSNGPYFGFLSENDQFSLVNMPNAQFNFLESVNTSEMIAGNFDNGDGYSSGFVRLFGYLHEVNANGVVSFVNGNNDVNQIVGEAYDFNTERWVGYVGELPLPQNVH